MNNKLSISRWIKVVLFLSAGILCATGILSDKLWMVLFAPPLLIFVFIQKDHEGYGIKPRSADRAAEIDKNRVVVFITYVVYALITGIVTLFISKKFPESPYVFFPWVVSLGLLITAGFLYDRFSLTGWIKHIKNLDRASKRKFYLRLALVGGITLVALVLRLPDLEHIPPMLHGDEGEFGIEALRAMGIGEPLRPFAAGWAGLSTVYSYFLAGMMNIFGKNLLGLRILSVLSGTACVPLMYLIGKKYWGDLAGITAAWLMAVSHFNIHYSRLAVNNIESTFFMVAIFLLILIPAKNAAAAKEPSESSSESSPAAPPRKSATLFILIGIMAGLAQYMYVGSRFIVVFMAVPLLVLLLQRRINLIDIGLIGISALLVYSPMLLYYLQSPESLLGRASYVSIFNQLTVTHNYGEGVTWANNAGKILVGQFSRNLNLFVRTGDNSSFYIPDTPAFDGFTAFMFWMGLGVVLARIKRLPELSLFTWFGLGLILAGVITNDPPNGTRLLVMTPSVYVIAGVFLQECWNKLRAFYQSIPNLTYPLAKLLMPCYCVMLGITLLINVDYYFNDYVDANISVLAISLAREIKKDSPINHTYLMGDGYIYSGHGTILFINEGNQSVDIKSLSDVGPLTDDGKGISIYAVGSHMDELRQNLGIFPQGVLEEFRSSNENIQFVELNIPAIGDE